MFDIVGHNVTHHQSNVDVPTAAAAADDDDSCLKLDLRGVNDIEQAAAAADDIQPAVAGDDEIQPAEDGGAAVDSARTLADIPDDYLMSPSARATGTDELLVAAERQDGAQSQTGDVSLSSSHSRVSEKMSKADVMTDSDVSHCDVSEASSVSTASAHTLTAAAAAADDDDDADGEYVTFPLLLLKVLVHCML